MITWKETKNIKNWFSINAGKGHRGGWRWILIFISQFHCVNHWFDGIWTSSGFVRQFWFDMIELLGRNATSWITYRLRIRWTVWRRWIFQTIRSICTAKISKKNEWDFASEEFVWNTYFIGVCWPIGMPKPIVWRNWNRLFLKFRKPPTGQRRVQGSAFISELS